MQKTYNKWTKDLSYSIQALSSIKDTVLPNLIKGNIYSIEEQYNEVLILFDQYSGIDYIRHDNKGIQGIASRVQWGNAWDTFTIRYKRCSGSKTEYEKRLEAIKEGYFYPALTLQAYFDNKKDLNLLSIAVIKTLDLYKFIEKNPDKVEKRRSDNEFLFIRWSNLKGLCKSICQ